MASTFKFLDRKSSEDETSVNDRAQLIMQLAQQQMRQQRNNQRAFALLLEKAAPSQRTTGGTDAMGKDKKAVQEPVKAKREQGQWDLDVIQEFVINDMQWGQPSNRQKKQMGRKVKAMELSIEDLILPPVPANDSPETYAELLETQELGLLRDDRAKDIESQLGKDGIVAAFKKYSDENGLQTNWDFVRMVLDDVQTICLNLKFAHNRVRPSTLAQHLEIVLSPHGDHQSPSYPSFHSTAGRVLAEVISGAYAGHREKLMRIGDTIGMNRVIGGYHFLTDHQVGQSLGSQLVLKIPQNLSINPVYETERTVDGRTAEAVAANFMDALEQRHRTMAVNKEENAEDNYVEGIRAAMATHSRETSHMTDILKAAKRHMFVFGSNLEGRNGKGAARHAQKFGASQRGVRGADLDRVEGNTYSLPTKLRPSNLKFNSKDKMLLPEMKHHFENFARYVLAHPEIEFHIPNLGMQNGGYGSEQGKKSLAATFTNAFRDVFKASDANFQMEDLRGRLHFDKGVKKDDSWDDEYTPVGTGLGDFAFGGIFKNF